MSWRRSCTTPSCEGHLDDPSFTDLPCSDVMLNRQGLKQRQNMREWTTMWYGGRRRSKSFDRMLKQQAYIIICIICCGFTLSRHSP
ncbi:hypothetical protein Pmani_031757 [Petrolisthes manimaculis]|uniref:Uncharacterized protein n=1 Tax=Petrolisthes manimaculis TaxID=1843537 RepID=A0AAE1TUI0_9EUCA|nr:hypothetical protein Pmani_031757 [Petrolisthes manimaculis]